MNTKPRESLILVLALLLVAGAFIVNVFLFPGVILPGPPFFLSILIAAYFLSPRTTAGVAVFATALKLAADVIQGTPFWLLTLYFIALVLVGLAGMALASRIEREAALADERKRLLKEVDERGRLLEAVVANAPVGISVLHGPNFRFELANPAYQAIAPGKAVLGRTVAESWPELADQVVPLLRHVFETGESFSATDMQLPVRRMPEGPVENLYFTYSYVLMRGTEGQANAILVLVTETTEQVRARQRIEELAVVAERRASELEAIVGSIADAVFVCDSQGKLSLVNRAGLALVGEEKQEALGTLTDYRDRLQLRGLDGLPISHEDLAFSRALRGEVTRGREESGIHPVTRRNVSLLISAAPLKDIAGRVIGAVEVAADVTRLKDLTEEAQRRAAELDVANKELQGFAYSMAHDLRAPARHVNAFSQLVLNEYYNRLDERGKGYLQFLGKASQKLGQLIDDLLKLTRVTRAEMKRQPVNLSEIAQSVAAELRRKEPDRTVEFTIAPGAVTSGDSQLLRTALENLMENAWKFTSTRTVTRIEFGVTQQNGTPVYYVKDNGVGFDMAYVGKLFGAFQRLHRAEDFPGTGIGLAIVQRIVERHGGRVWAEGAVDKGATFYFTLV